MWLRVGRVLRQPSRAARIHRAASDSRRARLTRCVILSVEIPRSTLETLNFSALDPSDALLNSRHAMDFKKTKGFGPVSPLSIKQEPASVEEW